MRRELIRISKFLSLVLRHDPSALGIALDEFGWVDVDVLLAAFAAQKRPLSIELLQEIIDTNEKRRFALSEDGQKIRASQGHSIGINLNLNSKSPPPRLFHGTATRNIESIRKRGLLRGSRDYVHLSDEQNTAKKVGMRHGKPIVLIVQTKEMVDAGIAFYQSENGVWLTESVSPSYIDFPE